MDCLAHSGGCYKRLAQLASWLVPGNGVRQFAAMMKQLRAGLDAPLSGMATAFSSSLFGLAGSLILGFLDLQLGQAMGRFFNELEDWLSAFANSMTVARGQLAAKPARLPRAW